MKKSGSLFLGIVVALVVVAAAVWHFDPSAHTRLEAMFGNPTAQMTMARRAFLGDGMTQDDRVGATWVKRAAANGSPSAISLLGVLYLGGVGVDQNFDQAIHWLSLAKDTQAQKLALTMKTHYADIEKLAKDQQAAARKKFLEDLRHGISASIKQTIDTALAQDSAQDKNARDSVQDKNAQDSVPTKTQDSVQKTTPTPAAAPAEKTTPAATPAPAAAAPSTPAAPAAQQGK